MRRARPHLARSVRERHLTGALLMTLVLPWPPTMNHYYTVARNRKILTREARDYHKAVAAVVMSNGWMFFPEHRLDVSITASPPDNRKRDLDNLLKPTLDALQKAGMFSDDSQIDMLSIRRGPPSKPGMLTVTIHERLAAL